MQIDWVSLGVVVVVAAAAALTVVTLVALAIVGLSARAEQHAGGSGLGREPTLRPAFGTAVAALCLTAAASVVGYGLYLMVA